MPSGLPITSLKPETGLLPDKEIEMHVLEKRPAEASAQPLRDAIIRESQNKVIARLEERPELAISTIATSGRIEDGLACHVQQGKFTTVTDLGRGMGGDAAGPSPGFHARTAIVGCVAMAVKMLAAREGLVFRSVEVTVEIDADDGALFGLGTGSAAPVETRVNIVVESDEAEDDVVRIVERALAMDPWYLALRDAQTVVPSLAVKPGSSLEARG